MVKGLYTAHTGMVNEMNRLDMGFTLGRYIRIIPREISR